MNDNETINRVAALVKAWFDEEDTMFDTCMDEPEFAWQAILAIARHNLTDVQKSHLAGGPLENLLAFHGADFIGRVVEEAKLNERFKYLLSGVWRNDMREDVWSEIVKIRKSIW